MNNKKASNYSYQSPDPYRKWKQQLGNDLSAFDYAPHDDADENSISITDASSSIHTVCYRLIGDGDIDVDDCQGAIHELNQLIGEDASNFVISLTPKDKILIQDIKDRLQMLIKREIGVS